MLLYQLSEQCFVLLSPLSFVIVRVESAATQVVARLNAPVGQTLGDDWPRAIQVLWQLGLGLVAQRGQHLLRVRLLGSVGA